MSDDYQIVKVGIVGEPIILKLEKMDNESVKIEIAIVGVKDGEINLKAGQDLMSITCDTTSAYCDPFSISMTDGGLNYSAVLASKDAGILEVVIPKKVSLNTNINITL